MSILFLDFQLAPQVLDPGQQRVDLLRLFTGGGPGPEFRAMFGVLDGVAVALERGDHILLGVFVVLRWRPSSELNAAPQAP